MKKASQVALALLAGAAIGASVGILFAPESGKRTRKKLGKKANQVKDDVADLTEQGKKAINDLKEQVLSSANAKAS